MTIRSHNTLIYYKQRITKQNVSIRDFKTTKLPVKVSQRLRFFKKRLLQTWLWRRQRKSFNRWRAFRFLKPFNLNGALKMRQKTDFRLKWILNNYINWRFNSCFRIKLMPKYLYLQNINQSKNQSYYNWFFRDVGNVCTQLGFLRSRTLVKRCLTDYKVSVNDFLLTSYFSKKHNSVKPVILESSRLFNVLVLQPNYNPNFMCKYNPKLQRSLNYNLTNIMLGR